MTTTGSSRRRHPTYGMTFGPGRGQVSRAIRRLTEANGYPPTVREIGAETGLAISTVHGHLDRMERDGLILRERTKNRTVRLV